MKTFLLLVAMACSSVAGFTQQISYLFTAPNAIHHEAEISVTADKLPGGPATFRMSRSSPGRYAKHEFGKNVYNVAATDGNGKKLPVVKTDADVYQVTGHNGKVVLTYTLFANYADGTYASVDITGYHLNMPAAFMWVKGLEKAPINIRFKPLNEQWKVATQLQPGADAFTFSAPNLQYFMDSPTKVAELTLREWAVSNPDGKKYTFRIAFDAAGTPDMFDGFAAKVQRMVQEAQAVFGEVPAFDYGTYTFIASINPWVRGDGMEHRNSTMITIPRTFSNTNSLLGVFAHEFFHCWNVERIRPADLEPFDFEKSNMSEGLWVAEGFTQYYGDLILKRAGLATEEDFLDDMTRLVNTKMNAAGAQRYTPVENSQRAVFVDAGVAIDATNYPNMYASYYTYGGSLALALDLAIRSQFANKSLDDYMRQLWAQFGKTGQPYTVASLQPALALVTSKTFAAQFFDNYVYQSQPFDYARVLGNANLAISLAQPNSAWAGNVQFATGSAMVTANTTINTPLYSTGIDIGDRIETIENKKITDGREFASVIANHQPGDVLPVQYVHRGQYMETSLRLGIDPTVKITYPAQTATPQQRAFKSAWLGSKIPSSARQ